MDILSNCASGFHKIVDQMGITREHFAAEDAGTNE
jgi:hypothetical protein